MKESIDYNAGIPKFLGFAGGLTIVLGVVLLAGVITIPISIGLFVSGAALMALGQIVENLREININIGRIYNMTDAHIRQAYIFPTAETGQSDKMTQQETEIKTEKRDKLRSLLFGKDPD